MKTVVHPKAIDYSGLLLLSAIWGSSFVAVEIALESYSALLIAFIRILLAALFFLPIIVFKKIPFPKDMKTILILIIAGVLNNAIPFYLISWGQQFINGSTAAIMLACGPFITLILSHYITHDEKFTFFKLIGVILGFCGVFILLGDDFLNQRHDSIYGELAVLLSTIGYLSSGLLLRKVSHIPTLICSTSMFITATLFLFPFVLFYEKLDSLVFNYSLTSILFLAIVPTALASLIRINLVQKVGVQFMSQVSYLIPMFAIFWTFIFFDEIPKQSAIFALILILFGLFIRKIKIKS